MENLLGQIYCWFQSFYGQDLSYGNYIHSYNQYFISTKQ